MAARGGFKPKDHVITEGFNTEKKGGLTRAEIAKANRAAAAARGRATKEANSQATFDLGLEPGKDGKPKNAPSENVEDASTRMLNDMRHVYKKLDGRSKLEKLMKSDREFLFMIKELMKIESAQLTAKIRAKEEIGGKGDRMVFVVLKGLEDEKPIRDMIEGPRDLKQSFVMNPDGSEYEGEQNA
jgi:hypothetical protein